MILDTGASHNTLQDLEYVEDYVTINKNRSITMKTASGHKMTVTHTGLSELIPMQPTALNIIIKPFTDPVSPV
ncbi:hypothetical protein B484DRAFT_403656 [Ochromonadaceae sp. CCMP2298]|nr:hypothetical protein B484DRAFT_403656 [Ochromonadaceae sp. CCMP2298]